MFKWLKRALSPGDADTGEIAGETDAEQPQATPVEAARQDLQRSPASPDAALRLAVLLQAQGVSAEAAHIVAAGLAHNPKHAGLLTCRGDLHHSAGEFEEAAACYAAALAAQPDDAVALANFGMLKFQQRDLAGAVAMLTRAADLAPYSATTLHRLGLALHAGGQTSDAIACYEQALGVAPDTADLHLHLAILLRERGDLPGALDHFRQALSGAPNNIDVQSRLAETLMAAGKLDDAVAACQAVLQIDPQHLEALGNLGSALQVLRRYDEAADAYHRALHVAPAHPVLHHNLGTLLQAEGYFNAGNVRREKFQQARAAFQTALAHDPQRLQTLLCLAALATSELRLDEGLAHYDRALALAPENPDTRSRRGLLELLMGRFEEGWRDTEYRFTQTGNKRLPPFSQPLWRNDFPLAGKTILLMAEQGMGDAIHFIRYVEHVARQTPAAILIEAPEVLRPLLQTLPWPVTLLGTGIPFPPFDCFCPLMSLPYAFGTRADSIPAPIPYLAADTARVAQWAKRLQEDAHNAHAQDNASPRIGIAWSGSPDLNNDFHRSIALAQFAALLPPGRRVYSLQKDVRASDAAALAALPQVLQLGEMLHDYADTAALIANLDLVITVDTSVAHLAGAMGKPVWILLPFLPDYRWHTGRDDSPWYPSARLFRQNEPAEWSPVFAQVRQALDNMSASNRANP